MIGIHLSVIFGTSDKKYFRIEKEMGIGGTTDIRTALTSSAGQEQRVGARKPLNLETLKLEHPKIENPDIRKP